MRIRRSLTLRLTMAVVLSILCLNLTPLRPVHAMGIVSTCNLTSLNTALSGGGTVFFTCSGTIIVTPTIAIAADTKIDATGQTVTLSGNNANPVFIVNSGVTLSLVNLTIANGLAVASSQGGGGVVNNGTLNVANSTFANNNSSTVSLTSLGGGGLYNNGTLNIINSTFSNNSANSPSGGGAIADDNSATATIVDSTFSNNSAYVVGGIWHHAVNPMTIINSTISNNSTLNEGGGVYNQSTMNLISTTVSGNQASGSGGGGLNEPTRTMNLVNSTFSGNSAGQAGGGIYNNGILNLVNSTFSGNSATTPNAGGAIDNVIGTLNMANSTFSANFSLGTGGIGGIQARSGGTATVRNSVVTSGLGGDCTSGLSGNNNLSDGTCPGTLAAVTNFNTALANNGGSTQTHALNAGSNAIDNIPSGTCTDTNGVALSTDQRGLRRPISTSCDIGSYESNAVNIAFNPTILPLASLGVPYSAPITASGGVGSYTFSLSSVPLVTLSGLPAGMTLSAGGIISGTPTSLGLSTFTLRAIDSNGDYADRTFGIMVLPPSPSLVLAPLTLPGGNVGIPYSQPITASAGTPGYTFALTAGSLPTGLTLSSGGVLSGTPTTAATFTFTITATDSVGLTGSQTYSVDITDVPTPSQGFTPNAVIGAFDPAISKVGVLQPNGVGFAGEKLTWVITVFNQGTVRGDNVTLIDTIADTMRVDGASTSQGTFITNGQTVTFNIGTLNPGQTVTLQISTTVLSSAVKLENTACASASTSFAIPNPRCATGQISPPSRLPSTGYPPADPPDTWLGLAVGLGLLMSCASVWGLWLYRKKWTVR